MFCVVLIICVVIFYVLCVGVHWSPSCTLSLLIRRIHLLHFLCVFPSTWRTTPRKTDTDKVYFKYEPPTPLYPNTARSSWLDKKKIWCWLTMRDKKTRCAELICQEYFFQTHFFFLICFLLSYSEGQSVTSNIHNLILVFLQHHWFFYSTHALMNYLVLDYIISLVVYLPYIVCDLKVN